MAGRRPVQWPIVSVGSGGVMDDVVDSGGTLEGVVGPSFVVEVLGGDAVEGELAVETTVPPRPPVVATMVMSAMAATPMADAVSTALLRDRRRRALARTTSSISVSLRG